MKTLFLALFLFPFSIISQQSIVKFESETLHLGKVKKGDKKEGLYTFTNISDDEVQIDIVSTCDCTEAKWTGYPLKPGESGKIEFIFDSNKKDHEETIDVDVYFVNTDPNTGNPISVFLSYTYEY